MIYSQTPSLGCYQDTKKTISFFSPKLDTPLFYKIVVLRYSNQCSRC